MIKLCKNIKHFILLLLLLDYKKISKTFHKHIQMLNFKKLEKKITYQWHKCHKCLKLCLNMPSQKINMVFIFKCYLNFFKIIKRIF